MKLFKKSMVIIWIVFVVIFSACSVEENAISVTFTDITLSGNTNITFFVKYEEEKNYKQKGMDILIKSDKDNVRFKIKKELEDFVEITLPQQNIYYSLSKLMQGNNFEYVMYKSAVNKNYIINSYDDFNLTLKAVAGELSEYKTMLVDTFDISKEFKLEVKKYEK